jgi:2-amino-4-hydroxy-6-hydroxymethyldihydropteridine diphosphokinase
MKPSASVEVVAYVGLGANLGEPAQTLRTAFQQLDALPLTRLTAASRLYRTPAWGVLDQPDFVNAVAQLRTALPAQDLLRALLAVERDFGRQRAADGSDRWGPRSLDLDVLLYGEARIDETGLHVPHPQMHRRAFVLVPLCEIAPDAMIPGIGRVCEVAAAFTEAEGGSCEALPEA